MLERTFSSGRRSFCREQQRRSLFWRAKPLAVEIMRYTVYFYDKPHPRNRSDYFADPTQEFYSLEEAQTFAWHAADTTEKQTVYSFRIETDDSKISEHWTRDVEGWKLSR